VLPTALGTDENGTLLGVCALAVARVSQSSHSRGKRCITCPTKETAKTACSEGHLWSVQDPAPLQGSKMEIGNARHLA
jgi:hypothetical protein